MKPAFFFVVCFSKFLQASISSFFTLFPSILHALQLYISLTHHCSCVNDHPLNFTRKKVHLKLWPCLTKQEMQYHCRKYNLDFVGYTYWTVSVISMIKFLFRLKAKNVIPSLARFIVTLKPIEILTLTVTRCLVAPTIEA